VPSVLTLRCTDAGEGYETSLCSSNQVPIGSVMADDIATYVRARIYPSNSTATHDLDNIYRVDQDLEWSIADLTLEDEEIS
jgi:hypothetical protein